VPGRVPRCGGQLGTYGEELGSCEDRLRMGLCMGARQGARRHPDLRHGTRASNPPTGDSASANAFQSVHLLPTRNGVLNLVPCRVSRERHFDVCFDRPAIVEACHHRPARIHVSVRRNVPKAGLRESSARGAARSYPTLSNIFPRADRPSMKAMQRNSASAADPLRRAAESQQPNRRNPFLTQPEAPTGSVRGSITSTVSSAESCRAAARDTAAELVHRAHHRERLVSGQCSIAADDWKRTRK